MQLKAFDIKTPLLSLVRSACPPKSSSGKNTCHAIVCSGWTFHNSGFFLHGHPGIFPHYLVKINFHNFLQREKGLTMSLFQLRTYKQNLLRRPRIELQSAHYLKIYPRS